MRLKNVFISEYKNLKDFSLTFLDEGLLEILVGKNGSGKSNFIEAIIEIFRHLYEFDQADSYQIYFSYKITFEIEENETLVEYDINNERLLINGLVKKTVGQTSLPDNILIYYAGHNTVVKSAIEEYEEKFEKKIINADVNESRKFIGIDSTYNEIFLTILLLLDDTSAVKQFVLNKLGIISINDSLRVRLKRPIYASKTNTTRFDIVNNDEVDKYWKAAGISRDFLSGLEACKMPEVPNVPLRTEGYLPDTDTYQLYFSLEKIREHFSDYGSLGLFRMFDNLKTMGMLENLSISIKLDGNKELTTSSFSDGQFQTIYLFAVSEIFKTVNCITLMDEPDSFLHPEWQADCVEQINKISLQAAQTNHIVMTSHSAVTLIKSPPDRIKYFDLKDGKAHHCSLPKRVAVQKLCSDVIKYTEQEQILSILNAIQIENKPVLFTEGSTDPIIIKEAWHKLYEEEMPFIPCYAFSCTYLSQLLTDQRIHNEMNGLPVFGLFDFDKAYDTWNGLNGDIIGNDIFEGLRKRWANGESYALMLPVPTNPEILRQVVKDIQTNKSFGGESLCEIEHLFYGAEGAEEFFELKPDRGGQLVVFKSDSNKTRFAKEFIPLLSSDCFETFRPMLDFIKNKIIERAVEKAA